MKLKKKPLLQLKFKQLNKKFIPLLIENMNMKCSLLKKKK